MGRLNLGFKLRFAVSFILFAAAGLSHGLPLDLNKLSIQTIASTSLDETRYPNGQGTSEVASSIVNKGGRTWPRGTQYLPEMMIGKTNQDNSANKMMWAFFKSISR